MSCLQTAAPQVVEAEEIGNVVIQEVESFPGSTKVHESTRHGAVILFERAGSGRSRSTKTETSLSDVVIGSVNKKTWVVSLLPTAPPLMKDEKLEDVGLKRLVGVVMSRDSLEGMRTSSCRFP